MMVSEYKKGVIHAALQVPFNEANFFKMVREILKKVPDDKRDRFDRMGAYIYNDFSPYITRFQRIGKYISPDKKRIDILIVHLKKETSLERARTMQRNFVAKYLKDNKGSGIKHAALVAFVSPNGADWRLSFVKVEYKFDDNGKPIPELSPARRYSFLIEENSHTARSRLLLAHTNPTLGQLEDTFSVEPVTDEFFEKYRELFHRLEELLDDIVANNKDVKDDFVAKGVDTADFAKKLLGQIVFLYFLQKKGWFGVPRDGEWGEGSKNFLRELFCNRERFYKQDSVDHDFFNGILEPLFYEALRSERTDDVYINFNCKIPFLNGGLFDPLNGYSWAKVNIPLPDDIFSNDNETGILNIFDHYNFTVNENEPLEKEVAVDPEMLGKVFENLLKVKDRQSSGTYYTPREIVHYMCRESLINYLVTELEGKVVKADIEKLIKYGEDVAENESRVVREGETGTYKYQLSDTVRENAVPIDAKLASIRVCDPAVGSGAFLVGMMNEIIRARNALTPHINSGAERPPYHFKRQAIENCLYGVDIDSSATEIAKLRLWLSLVVDEEDRNVIKPLPNLDYKIVPGNALLNLKRGLFNYEKADDYVKLKKFYIRETRIEQKQVLANQINELINRITNGRKEFDCGAYFLEVFLEKEGFDVVIANPPYIGEKGHKEKLQEVKVKSNLKRFHQGKMGYFYFFFHLALDLSHRGSNIAFITTNYYVTATAASKLRKDLKNRSTILKLIDFSELKIFKSAKGQHNIITILQKWENSNEPVYTATTHHIGLAKPGLLHKILDWKDKCTDYYEIKQENIYEGDENYIRIVTPRISEILDTIKNQATALGSICKLSKGMYTGADKVSKNHIERYGIEANIGDGIFVLSDREISSLFLTPEERDILKPWFKNSDIKRYYTSMNTGLSVLYLRRQFWENDIPNIIRHLSKFKQILKKGEITQGGNQNWYNLDRPREQYVFNSPKIVAPLYSKVNTFGYNEVSWYTGGDVHFITKKDHSAVFLKYVLALLNSRLYYFWLYHRGKRKGESLELSRKPLSEVPIKISQPDEQEPFVALVDKILSITGTDDYLQNPTKQAQVRGYEKQIDKLVYDLYDLTPDEIEIIKANPPQ